MLHVCFNIIITHYVHVLYICVYICEGNVHVLYVCIYICEGNVHVWQSQINSGVCGM